jgi:hypothetical protein
MIGRRAVPPQGDGPLPVGFLFQLGRQPPDDRNGDVGRKPSDQGPFEQPRRAGRLPGPGEDLADADEIEGIRTRFTVEILLGKKAAPRR